MRTYLASLTRRGKHTHAAVTARLLTDPAVTEPDQHLLPEAAYASGETVLISPHHQIMAGLTR